MKNNLIQYYFALYFSLLEKTKDFPVPSDIEKS